MRNSILLGLIFLVFSCNKPIDKKDIPKLNGYWEIDKVILKNGDKKQYKVNQSIDYIEIHNNQGFRKKVIPQLNGRFVITDNEEKILISDTSNTYYINYMTDYAKWNEQILEITDSTFTVKNNQDIEYHYKKFTPFSLK